MIIAGWILLGLSFLLMIIALAANISVSTLLTISFLIAIFLLLIAPGVVFLSVGYSLKKKKAKEAKQANTIYYVCSECGYQVFTDYKCCPKCGSVLNFEQNKVKFCIECGKELSEDHSFCPYCGTQKIRE